MGALSKLDEFLLNRQVRTLSGTVPGTSRYNDLENGERTWDRSQSDLYPEVEFCIRRTSHSVDSDQEETSHMVTGAREEILQCSAGTSREKKKAHSTSQPQFHSEITLSTIEAGQNLLALQQLASNSNSANFNNNINRISKLPKSFMTTMPTFDWKSEKFELFEDLFQTSLKDHNQLTEKDKINYFHSHAWWCAADVQKISSPSSEKLGEILSVFCRKYVKPPSMATEKIQISTSSFQSSESEVNWFSGRTPETRKTGNQSCRPTDHRTILICQDASPHLEKSLNQAHLENGT